MYASGSVSQPLHFTIQPGWPPPEAFPGARHRGPELAVGVLRVLLERTVLEPLLVAQLDPAQVEHRVLHRALDPLAAAGLLALVERGEHAGHQVDAGAGVADLGAGHQRDAVDLAGGRRRAAGALGDVLVDLAVRIRARAEALDRGVDHPRVDLLDPLPR